MSDSPSGVGAPVFVEDLFLTGSFLIKGRLANKYHRLSKMLEDNDRTFLTIEDAVMVSLRGSEVVRTPSVLVNTDEIVFAHELVDVAGDEAQRTLARDEKPVRIRAFYNGSIQFEIAGSIAAGAYDNTRGPQSRRYFVMAQPRLRGLNTSGSPELGLLDTLSYAIVQKRKLAYIYDLG